MIVDTSAILAIFLDEPEKDNFLTRILMAEGAAISSANFLETCLKVDRASNEIARQAFDEFFDKLGLEIAPVSLVQTRIARRANQLYGADQAVPPDWTSAIASPMRWLRKGGFRFSLKAMTFPTRISRDRGNYAV